MHLSLPMAAGGGAASSVLHRLIQNATLPKPNPPSPPSSPIPSLLSHLHSGNLSKALSLLSSSSSSPSPLPSSLYSRLLSLASSRRSLPAIRRLESHIISTSLPSPPTFLLNRTIEAYALCNSLSEARDLFDEMPNRNFGTYNAMISAYSRHNRPTDALSLFSRMNHLGIPYNDVTFASVLSSCADVLALFLAKQVHGLISKHGYCDNVILATSLVDVYGKCWLIGDARRVFDLMRNPNAVSWNVIVRRYLEVGRGEEAVGMFFRMLGEGTTPLSFTVSNALLACSEIPTLHEGRKVHAFVVKAGYGGDVVDTSLMKMYLKCRAVEDVRRVFEQSTCRSVWMWTLMVSCYATCGRIGNAEVLFDEMPERDVVSWNAMLAGYVQLFMWQEGFAFFHRMRRETEEIDEITLGLVLNTCAGISDLDRGKQVHGFAYRHGFSLNLFFSNALVDMYSKCGSLRSAEILFLQMACRRDRVSWNSLLSGYARNGRSEEALDVFVEMQQENTPNEITFIAMLTACANVFAHKFGKQIHGYMIRNGFKMDVVIRGVLVDMYSKCRSIDYAIKVFEGDESRDLVLWNSMILGCAYNGRGERGLELFAAMKIEGIRPDNVSFAGVLLSCVGAGYVKLGQSYFESMSTEYGVIPRVEHYECIIELLGRHGFMVELEDFIQKMPFEPTIPMWMKIFDCCREHGNSRLGERAARCINESNPLVPIRFELLSGTYSDCG